MAILTRIVIKLVCNATFQTCLGVEPACIAMQLICNVVGLTCNASMLTCIGIGVLNGARLMVLQPTTPGTLYTIQFCALGGSTSQSQWSHPVTLMAT